MRISVLATLVMCLVLATCCRGEAARAETADQAVKRYMATTKVGCWDFTRHRTMSCPLSSDGIVTGMGEGTFPGETAKILVAVFAYPNESGGNSSSQFGAVFIERDNRYVFVRRLENIYGQDLRDFQFLDGGNIRFTATTLRPEDPRCCPTGTETKIINVGPLPATSGPTSALADVRKAAGISKAEPVWIFGRHPVLGLSAHVVVGEEAFGVACTKGEPTSVAVASARMTPGLVPDATDMAVDVFTGPFDLGGGTAYQANKAGFVENVGGFCTVRLDRLVKSKSMMFIKSKKMSLDWDGRKATMTVEVDGSPLKLATAKDMDAIRDPIVVPLKGARAAIAKLLRSCPAINRMKDIDCTGGD